MEKLTSAHVEETLLNKFKEETKYTKLTMRQLIERTMFLYITDSEFKKRINNQLNTTIPV